ncbi:class IV adenylate cyclase [Candidatus Parcubacteria bacterium]|nr:class IV adenylate cyclase [Candidatus Parcubacteria bacterium]
MTNKLEIEKKYYIKNSTIDDLTKIIEKSGAEYIGDSKQRDIYFNVPGRDSLTSKECLRIRESETKKEITYKPPTKESDMNNGFFAKKEINLLIQDVEVAKILLLDIGCTVLAEVKKERKRFRLDKFKIFIDNIQNVGLFIEIEIMDIFDNIQKGISEIDELMDGLNMNNYITENKPYRDLVIEKEKGEE